MPGGRSDRTSDETSVGKRYLPAIARRLHHGRDLGEPWDFLTWFEYASADEAAFVELVGLLRTSPEWRYVAREYDLRLVRGEEADDEWPGAVPPVAERASARPLG